MSGELIDFVTQKTEDGLQIVGVVLTKEREILYVPTLALTLIEEKIVVH
jgi:hypothetical protein